VLAVGVIDPQTGVLGLHLVDQVPQ
jgi:hypothetical protein